MLTGSVILVWRCPIVVFVCHLLPVRAGGFSFFLFLAKLTAMLRFSDINSRSLVEPQPEELQLASG